MSIFGLLVFGAMSYLKSKKLLTTQGSTGRLVGFVFVSPSSTAFFQPTFLSPPEAWGLRPPDLPWVAGVFRLAFLAELLGRSPSLRGVAGVSFSVPMFPGGVALEVFWERRIERGTAVAGRRPTPLLGGDHIRYFLVAPLSSTGAFARLRVFVVNRVRIRSWFS